MELESKQYVFLRDLLPNDDYTRGQHNAASRVAMRLWREGEISLHRYRKGSCRTLLLRCGESAPARRPQSRREKGIEMPQAAVARIRQEAGR